MTFTYPAVFKKQPDGSYTATFPDLTGIEVRGRDLDDAIRNARDAMFDWLTVEFDEEDPRLPMISEVRDLKLKRGETARNIEVHYRFFEGWDE